jgi:hypothetical protein
MPDGTAMPSGAFGFAPSLELGGDRVERAAEVGADGAHHGHGGDGDQRGDQSVLDRSGSVLVFQ